MVEPFNCDLSVTFDTCGSFEDCCEIYIKSQDLFKQSWMVGSNDGVSVNTEMKVTLVEESQTGRNTHAQFFCQPPHNCLNICILSYVLLIVRYQIE